MDLLIDIIICVGIISIFYLRSRQRLAKLTSELRQLQKDQVLATQLITTLQEDQRRLARAVAQFHLARVAGRRQA